MIGRSPFDRGMSLLSKENNKRLRHLDQDEIGRLLDACINDHTRDIIETVIHTGMRRQEVLSLKWNRMTGGFIHLTRTKADEVREIPINDDLVALCRRVRARDELNSEKELQEMLGYKPMVMTMRQAHLSQEHKKKAINLLNGLTTSPAGNCHKTVTSSQLPQTATS